IDWQPGAQRHSPCPPEGLTVGVPFEGVPAGNHGKREALMRLPMRGRGLLSATLGLLALFLATSSVSTEAAAPRGTLRVAAKADMTNLDPATAVDDQSWIVVEQMFNGLYNFDKDGRTYPDLAEALPRISADGLTYTVPLRKGVRFHHGREVDAEDVKFSFERTLTPATKSWGQRFLAP